MRWYVDVDKDPRSIAVIASRHLGSKIWMTVNTYAWSKYASPCIHFVVAESAQVATVVVFLRYITGQ